LIFAPNTRSIIKCLKVFKSLEGQLGVFEDDVGVVRAPVYTEQGESLGKYDNQTESYEEKVLPDGSVLRINKTLIHDTDEEGNGFFFQSSIHHILEDIEDEIEDVAEEIEDDEEEIEENENSYPVEDDDDVLGFVDEDPTLNEVLDEKFPTASVEDLLD